VLSTRGGGSVFRGRLATRGALFAAAPVTTAICGRGRCSPYGRVQADRRGGIGSGGSRRGCSRSHFSGRSQDTRFVWFETGPSRGGDCGNWGWLQMMVDDRRPAGW